MKVAWKEYVWSTLKENLTHAESKIGEHMKPITRLYRIRSQFKEIHQQVNLKIIKMNALVEGEVEIKMKLKSLACSFMNHKYASITTCAVQW